MKTIIPAAVLALAALSAGCWTDSVSLRGAALLPMPREVSCMDGELTVPAEDSGDVLSDAIVTFDSSLPSEGYAVDVDDAGIRIRAADAAGAFYAGQTLRSIASRRDGGGISLPYCRIRDWPEFSWRGVLLDESRHFFGKTAVKELLDLMAMHRLNVFHWHLTDADGWRLEIPAFPELVTYGAVRPSGVAPDFHGADLTHTNEKYGPYYYTADDVREILNYAAERQITVVPEIELPSHSRAALAAYPELSCLGETLQPRVPHCTIGPQYEVFCAGNDDAIRFLEKVFDYVCELFPSREIGIGGDECPKDRWKVCAKCQARVKALGLGDENGLQNWMTRHFSDYLAAKGRRALAWDETVGGKMPTNMLVQVWHEPKDAVAAARAGCDVVMSPAHCCYFDFRQGLEEDSYNYYGDTTLTLAQVALFDPYDGFPDDLKHRVKGVECCSWSELTWGRFDLAWKMWPRTCVFAEIAWRGPSDRAPQLMERVSVRRKALIKRFVNCAPLAGR